MPRVRPSIALSGRTNEPSPPRGRFSGPVEDLLDCLVQKPLVGAAALWIVCYPLVFFLYDDLFISASTLAGMTIWFLAFLFAVICIMVAIGFAVAFLFEVIGKRRKASSR